MDHAKPIKTSYRVVPSKFLAGEYPGSRNLGTAKAKLNVLVDFGVTAFVDLTEPDEGLEPYHHLLEGLDEVPISYKRFPIADLSVPSSRDLVVEILDHIDGVIADGGMVYLHCRGGVGRTGTIVGCWLARHGYKRQAALDRLQELWSQCPKSDARDSPETPEQIDFILNWDESAASDLASQYVGSLMGLAAGDAVGTTIEFKPPGSFRPVNDMIGGGPFNLKPGEWTDDTSMGLCLAESLIQCNGFDAKDQMDRYWRWYQEGYLSSNGECFDIGNTIRAALQRYKETGDPYAGSNHPRSAGNGSIMRLAPLPLFYASDPETAIRMSAESSKTTHGAVTCLDACRYLGGLIVGAIHGASKEELLSSRYSPVHGLWKKEPLCPEIEEIAQGSFKDKEPPEIVGSGHVVKSLEAALWAFHKSTSFEEGCLLAVNLGNDADTTGAVYGQLAGAYYGEEGIPDRWRERLAHSELIRKYGIELSKKRHTIELE